MNKGQICLFAFGKILGGKLKQRENENLCCFINSMNIYSAMLWICVLEVLFFKHYLKQSFSRSAQCGKPTTLSTPFFYLKQVLFYEFSRMVGRAEGADNGGRLFIAADNGGRLFIALSDFCRS